MEWIKKYKTRSRKDKLLFAEINCECRSAETLLIETRNGEYVQLEVEIINTIDEEVKIKKIGTWISKNPVERELRNNALNLCRSGCHYTEITTF